MNLEHIVSFLLALAGIYLALGLLFGIYFAFFAAGKVDPNAAAGSKGFRVLIIPGMCLFWPLFAMRLVKGVSEPPDERNAHREQVNGGTA